MLLTTPARFSFLALAVVFLGGFGSFAGYNTACTLRSKGAAGTGAGDDSAAINTAFSTCNVLYGEGLSYRVMSRINGQSNTTLSDATIIRAIPANQSENTTLKYDTKVNFSLVRVKIDLGNDPTYGTFAGEDMNTSQKRTAGILITGSSPTVSSERGWLEDVEVTGKGVATAIKMIYSDRIWLIRPNVHDLEASNSVAGAWGSNEILVGIWPVASKDIVIKDMTIANLSPASVGTGVDRSNMSDGFDSSGNDGLSVEGGTIHHVGEGGDASGSDRTTRATFKGLNIHDTDTVCFKTGTSRNLTFRDGTLARCGWYGLLVFTYADGPHDPPSTRDIIIDNVSIADTGSNGFWAHTTTYGIWIDAVSGYSPLRVSISNLTVTSTTGGMNYCAGWRSEVQPQNKVFLYNLTTCTGYLTGARDRI
jgi:hypothetical protein